ncbi:hypothetical protein PR048_031379 [Dryococelus australis]|uniref:PiggyBac transposable element-derived protein domain-containing protein n=1 Tax=Dryococelus australis TaxID=614101 RepID=A0ABQ9G543_9NEOP|nr:hypothetical protein PR048_031379 [Dryococelus australis]
MDDDTIVHIVKQTNLYASQDHHHGNDNSKPRKIQNWADTSPEEIRAFSGMLIIMGIHQLTHLCNYWSSDPILDVESVSKIMNLERFRKTSRVNRKGLPDMLKTNDKLQRGEFMFSIKGPVAAVKWQDSKPVTVLSTGTSPKDTISVTRKNNDETKTTVSCPTAIQMYNALMGGVDLFDQLRERYTVGRRPLKTQMVASNLLLSTRSGSCKFIYHGENGEGRSRPNDIHNSACKAADLWLHFQEAKRQATLIYCQEKKGALENHMKPPESKSNVTGTKVTWIQYGRRPTGITEPLNELSYEIWSTLNNQVLRADGGEMRREWSSVGMQGWRETGGSRENPPNSGIVRHDSHLRKSGRGPRRESNPVRHGHLRAEVERSTREEGNADANTARPGSVGCEGAGIEQPRDYRSKAAQRRPSAPGDAGGAAVAERLARSPPTIANRVRSPAGSLPEFRKRESCRAMPLVGGVFFLGDLPLPRPMHSGAAPYSPLSPSSALKTSQDSLQDNCPRVTRVASALHSYHNRIYRMRVIDGKTASPAHCSARRGDERVVAHVSIAPSAPMLLGLRRPEFLQPGGHLKHVVYAVKGLFTNDKVLINMRRRRRLFFIDAIAPRLQSRGEWRGRHVGDDLLATSGL